MFSFNLVVDGQVHSVVEQCYTAAVLMIPAV